MEKRQSKCIYLLLYLAFTLGGLGLIQQIAHCVQLYQREKVNFEEHQGINELKAIIGEAEVIFSKLERDEKHDSLAPEKVAYIYDNIEKGLVGLKKVSFLNYHGSKTISNKEKYQMLTEINKKVDSAKIIDTFELIAKHDDSAKDLVELITSYQYFNLLGSIRSNVALEETFNYDLEQYVVFGYDRKVNLKFETVVVHARNQVILFKYLAKWFEQELGGMV